MRRDLVTSVRAVCATVLLVAAVLLGVGAALTGPASAQPAETAADDTSQSPTGGATAGSSTEEPAEGPSDGPSEEPTGQPTGTDEPTETTEPTETAEPTDEPSESTGPEDPDGVIEVDDATFRWGINNQSNARSHNPAAINFLSAGVANPGRGGVQLLEKHWNARTGNVTVQKWLGEKRGWQRATWKGLGTNASGTRINSTGVFSNHTVLLSRGSGSVDPDRGDATLTWKGTFTVVYYGGNSIFTVTDPKLVVESGAGRITAVLGGFAASRENTTEWEPVPSRRVTIAELGKVKVSKGGFVTTPDYLGRKADGSVPQVGGKYGGSFPQPMIDFLKPLAIDQFWYSTGLSTDDTKLPLPITVGYQDQEPVAPTPDPEPTDEPTVHNPTSQPPPQQPAAPPAPVVPAPPGIVPTVPADVPLEALPHAVQLTASAAEPAAATAATSTRDLTWWWVGALCTAAALLLLVPSRSPRPAPATARSRA
ncbi:hypothetical protein [Nocardioides daejeonensis]|uniref:hypothetical protein n=1 Tax=Nocardioides daejeonensis TaxID=1046556 RepID=UPI000D74437D|nr:hypothetical protein [Nocardioides daejeonensis]